MCVLCERLFCFHLFTAGEEPRDIILTRKKKNDGGNSNKVNAGSESKRTHPKCLSWQDPWNPSSPSPHCRERAGSHLTKAPEDSGYGWD